MPKGWRRSTFSTFLVILIVVVYIYMIVSANV